MSELDDLMKRHGVKSAGYYNFGSICCWVNRDTPLVFVLQYESHPALTNDSVYLGQNGWRVGWAPTLTEAFMIALSRQDERVWCEEGR